MVAPDGREFGSPSRARAAEVLLRSLVGVADADIRSGDGVRLDAIRIVPRPGASYRQISRNVASALMARFGVVIDPEAIMIAAPDAETVDNGASVADGAASPAAARNGQHPPHSNGNGHAGPPARGNGSATNGSMTRPHDEVGRGLRIDSLRLEARTEGPNGSRPARTSGRTSLAGTTPSLESVEIQRFDRGMRCRVAIHANGDTWTSVGDGPDHPGAEIELAARVTVDALRSARTPSQPVQLEGTATALVAGRVHILSALAVWNGSDFDCVSGAEPLHGSAAEAAAYSVIRAVSARMHAST